MPGDPVPERAPAPDPRRPAPSPSRSPGAVPRRPPPTGAAQAVAVVAERRGNDAARRAGALLVGEDGLLDDAWAGPEPEDYFVGALDPALVGIEPPPTEGRVAEPDVELPGGAPAADGAGPEAGPAGASDVAPEARAGDDGAAPPSTTASGSATALGPAGAPTPTAQQADGAPTARAAGGESVPEGTITTPDDYLAAVGRAASALPSPQVDPTAKRARVDRPDVSRGRAFASALAGRAAEDAAARAQGRGGDGRRPRGGGRAKPPITDPVDVDPVPESTKAVADAAKLRLPPAQLPAPMRPPNGPEAVPRQPTGVRDTELGRPEPPPAPEPRENARTRARRAADERRAAAERAQAQPAAQETATPEPIKPPVILDLGVPPTPKVDERQAVEDRKAVQAVIARLKADLHQPAKAVAKHARLSAGYGPVLQEELEAHAVTWSATIGDDKLVPPIVTAMSEKLDELATTAGIAADVLNEAVVERRRALVDSGQRVSDEARAAARAEANVATGEAERRAGEAEAADRAAKRVHLQELQAALHRRDRRLVDQLRDERLRILTEQVARGTIVFDDARKRRRQLIDDYANAYIEAYRKADDAAQATTEPRKVPMQDNEPWLRYAERVERARMDVLKRQADEQAQRLVDGLVNAGLDAKAKVRDWAESRVRHEDEVRDREAERARDRLAQLNANSEMVKQVERERARDDLVNQIRYAKGFHDLLQAEAAGTITEEQKRILDEGRQSAQAYLGAGSDPADPLSAVAKHLSNRFGAEHRERMTTEQTVSKAVDAMPLPTDTDGLVSVGKVAFATKPPDAAKRVSDLSAATREKYGTEEKAVFAALDNLSPRQIAIVKTLYKAAYGEGLYDRLDGELSGDEWKRAKALMASDQALAVAAAVEYERSKWFSAPDRAEVVAAIQTLPPGQVQKMKMRYKDEYDGSFDDAIVEVMREYRIDEEGREDRTSPDERGVEQVKLMLQVNTLRGAPPARRDDREVDRLQAQVDAINLDRAMRPINGAAKADAVDATFKRIRTEVAEANPTWTQAEVDAEVRRRNAVVEQTYGDRFGATITGGKPEDTPLRRVIASHLHRSGEKEIAGALLDVNRVAEVRARLLLADRGAYATDDDVNAALQSNYEHAADEVRRSEGPKLRAALDERIAAARRAGRPMSNDEIDAAERQLERDLETKIDERARVLLADVNRLWGKTGGMSLTEWVKDRTQWGGEDEAVDRLGLDAQSGGGGGRLSRSRQLALSVKGWGMDKDQAVKALEGRTPEEIKAIAADFKRITGDDLHQRLRAESSGRNRFDIDEALRGVPLTAEERFEALTRRRNYERTAYFSGSESMRDSAVGGNLELLEVEYRSAKRRYERLKNAPADLDQDDLRAMHLSFTKQAARTVTAAEDYRAAVDRYVDQVVQVVAAAVAITVGVVLGVLTGGAALPLVALAASLWGTAATVVTKMVLLGRAYGIHEYIDDVAMGAVDAAFAYATAGLGDKLLGLGKVAGGSPAAVARAVAARELARKSKPLMAKLGAELVEQAAGAAPSALVGNVMNRENWRGDPFKNIMKGTAVQTGIGIGVGGTMSLGTAAGSKLLKPAMGAVDRLRGKVPELDAAPAHVEPTVRDTSAPPTDVLAKRGTAEDRAAAFREWKETNPGTMKDFLRELDAGVASAEVSAEMRHKLQRELRTELLEMIPRSQRKEYADTPITVLSDAEFTARTGSMAKGQAAVLVIEGKPHVVVREGAPPWALREEGIHLQQLRDPVHADKLPLLDERRLANWKDLSVEERTKSWDAKLELELDAQIRKIVHLNDRLKAAGGWDPEISHQLTQAHRAHENLAKWSNDLRSFRDAGGTTNPPRFLEEPSRLFTKLDEPPPAPTPTPAKPPKPPKPAKTHVDTAENIAAEQAARAELQAKHDAIEKLADEAAKDLERIGAIRRKAAQAEADIRAAADRARTEPIGSEARQRWNDAETEALRRRVEALDELAREHGDYQRGKRMSAEERQELVDDVVASAEAKVNELRSQVRDLHDALNPKPQGFVDETKPLAGRHKHLDAQGGENNHIPASDAIEKFGIKHADGLCVRMDKSDHVQTASWGGWDDAKKFRALQKKLIDEGKFFEAVKMDLDDMRSRFGTKYEKGIQQMLDIMERDPAFKRLMANLNRNSTLTIADLRRFEQVPVKDRVKKQRQKKKP